MKPWQLSPLLIVSSFSYLAHAETTQSGWVDQLLEKLGASETIDTSEGIDWGVLPGPFANPEQGVGFGMAQVGLYSPADWTPKTHYSTLAIKSYISSTGSYGLGVENRSYLNEDKLRLIGDAWISHSPQHYWGIGKKAAQNDDNKREYNGQIIKLTPKVSYEFLPDRYISLGWDYQHYSQQTLAPTNSVSKYKLSNQQSSGISIALEYDSRDFEPNPYSGQLWFAEWIDYKTALGSDQNYTRLTLNYRQYVQLNGNNILAWDVYGQRVDGDIPWYGYAEMGNDERMRGYYTGQYRDRYLLSGQIEWRHRFNQRHGMVTWFGGGNIANKSEQLLSSKFLPTFGVGYRFAFKPRINVRIDYALGKDSSGFYFHINEAF
ncbi:BamA/TamA family outer membrane protein [Photobacterium leiognathi]|uniref:BamA/TamA family outer membrane protein n=1 Tax=Photobacterium leiognathi TaxID=553611 RepID=UPI002734E49F|nr:BamA/TamA family outer membrane protein [Photobacterium leiognathi]